MGISWMQAKVVDCEYCCSLYPRDKGRLNNNKWHMFGRSSLSRTWNLAMGIGALTRRDPSDLENREDSISGECENTSTI